MFDKKAQTQVSINDLLSRRWSGRAFDPARNISMEQIIALLEAARWSPSCMGDQPWRWIVCHRDNSPDAWQKAIDCLSEGNQVWARYAPLLILTVASMRFSGNGKANRWGQYDTGAASMSLCIQATDMGLMVHQMGGFDADRSKLVFAIPEDHDPMAMIAVGYQLSTDAIPADLQERELAPRRRNPLEQNFFHGTWGKSLPI